MDIASQAVGVSLMLALNSRADVPLNIISGGRLYVGCIAIKSSSHAEVPPDRKTPAWVMLCAYDCRGAGPYFFMWAETGTVPPTPEQFAVPSWKMIDKLSVGNL